MIDVPAVESLNDFGPHNNPAQDIGGGRYRDILHAGTQPVKTGNGCLFRVIGPEVIQIISIATSIPIDNSKINPSASWIQFLLARFHCGWAH